MLQTRRVEQRTVHVPVASNAYSLLVGRPVEAVRQRLKVASVLYDEVIIEAGLYRFEAGAEGGVTSRQAPSGATHRWQTPKARGVAEHHGLQVSVSIESAPGVPAAPEAMRPFIRTSLSRAWTATLEPFGLELPSRCNWVEWVFRPQSPTGLDEAAAPGIRRDGRNPALERMMPDRAVRSGVIEAINQDLVVAASNGAACSIDSFHARVFNARIDPESNWNIVAFALPILSPRVEQLPWEAIADIRRDRHIKAYRKVMLEIETEAAELVRASGDLEEAVHRLYHRRAQTASERLGAKSFVKSELVGLVLGAAGGALTSGIAGPASWGAGAVASQVLSSIVTLGPGARRRRETRRWLAVGNRIDAALVAG